MSDRISESRFPVLRDQLRTSTGYTHSPRGVLRLPPGWGDMPRTGTPPQRDISIAPKPKAARGRPKIRGDL